MRNLMKKSLLLLLTAWLTCQAQPLSAQETLKVMSYNLLRYGAQGISCTPTGVTARNAWFSAILNDAQPDIFGVNEIGPSNGPTAPYVNILNNILKPINSAYAAANVTFNASQDIANAFFYNSDKLGLKSQAVIPHSLRNIDYYRLYYKGPGLLSGDTTWIEVVLLHLHSSDASIRSSQTAAVMTYLGNLGRPGNFIVMGDMNMDGSSSGAFQNLVSSANANIDMADPINLTGTWSNNNSARHAWSQSTRGSGSSDCGSGGGLDDRFDIIVCSNSIINNTDDVRYIPSSYHVFGNTNAPNPAVSAAAASALAPMSDHYPVYLSLEISKAVAVDPQMPTFNLGLLGNPVDHLLQARVSVTSELTGLWEARLLDLQGRNIATQLLDWPVGDQLLEFPTSTLPAGLYLLELSSPQGFRRTTRIQVIHP
jgi:hypothetical protein